MDLLGKEALEDSLKGYTGTMLFVSHDRYFISKIATAILVIDEGKALYYPLNYQEYMERKKNGAEPQIKETVTQKQKPVRMINYGKEIKKLEKQIDEKEAYLEELRERRFEPEYYHDFRKMNELDQMIDDVHNEIEHLMELWETYSEMIS